jgi:malonyl-CoA decarboxylase
LLRDKDDRLAAQDDPEAGAKWVERLRAAAADADHADSVRRSGLRLAAHYLKSMKNNQPLDPVARFHLGNGARIERVNWAGDTSAKGLAQSCGIMANYVYELDQLDDNLVQLTAGRPRVSRSIQWL